MKKVLIVSILALIILTSCQIYESKHDYFDGTVLVEYFQIKTCCSDDSLTLTFNEKGNYYVQFSYTERYWQLKTTLPEDLSITVVDSPKTKVVSQYVLPNFLTVTITHNNVIESHDFK